jgi:peptide methionine sulfoxide reductase MsrA
MSRTLLLLLLLSLTACQSGGEPQPATDTSPAQDAPTSQPAAAPKADATQLAPAPQPGESVATFAGGCFWCMEGPFEQVEGVRAVLSGYTGGLEQGPTYKQVSAGRTGHTDAGGQFADRGPHYRPAIFFHTPEQEKAAQASKAALQASGRFTKPIVVPIQPATDFWVAEDYHQDYYKTNADHYNRYKVGSGRAGFLKQVWGQ